MTGSDREPLVSEALLYQPSHNHCPSKVSFVSPKNFPSGLVHIWEQCCKAIWLLKTVLWDYFDGGYEALDENASNYYFSQFTF